MIGDNILDTFFETFATEKIFDEFVVELITRNEALESLDDKKDWDIDDCLIASMQFMDFVLEARGKFLEKYIHLIL